MAKGRIPCTQLVEIAALFQSLKVATAQQCLAQSVLFDLLIEFLEPVLACVCWVQQDIDCGEDRLQAFLGLPAELSMLFLKGVMRPAAHVDEVLIVHVHDVVEQLLATSA
jgi:hypothetical protein